MIGGADNGARYNCGTDDMRVDIRFIVYHWLIIGLRAYKKGGQSKNPWPRFMTRGFCLANCDISQKESLIYPEVYNLVPYKW
jgi:hypothetical protein